MIVVAAMVHDVRGGWKVQEGPGTAVAVSRRWEMVEMGGREE